MTDFHKPLVQNILENHGRHEWTIQGLGMLRTYLPGDLRLHVWSSTAEFEDVSKMHTHPWDFESRVIAGKVVNIRFTWPDPDGGSKSPICFQRQMIRCGQGGGIVGEPEEVSLIQGHAEGYLEGSVYRQQAHEIHVSLPKDGTVTLIQRSFHEDTEHAYVYFPIGEEWVTAEPRAATPEEVERICEAALSEWF